MHDVITSNTELHSLCINLIVLNFTYCFGSITKLSTTYDDMLLMSLSLLNCNTEYLSLYS